MSESRRESKIGLDDSLSSALEELIASPKEPLAKRVDMLIDIVEEMHSVSRDRNAMLCDMLFQKVKGFNTQLNDLHEEIKLRAGPEAVAAVAEADEKERLAKEAKAASAVRK